MNRAMPTARSVATDAASAEQLGQVDLQVTGIGPAARPRERRCPGAGRTSPLAPCGSREAKALSTPRKCSIRSGARCRGASSRTAMCSARGDRPPDRLLRPRLDLARPPQPLQRHRPERVQQHGLAHPAQPGEHHAAFRPAAGYPFQHHLELAELTVAAGQFGRALASSGRIRIPDRVHGIGAYGRV